MIVVLIVVILASCVVLAQVIKTSKTNSLSAAAISATSNNISTLPSSVKVYRALISQTGTNNPTVDAVLENTTGGNITYHRIAGGGRYYLSINNNAFTIGKTFATIGSPAMPCNAYISEGMTAALVIGTMRNDNVASTQNDTCLSRTPVEVLIYP